MADNKTIKDGSGTDFILALKDNTSVFFPKSIPHNDSGNPAAFGEGVLGATVQRVSLATDDDLVTSGANIDTNTTDVPNVIGTDGAAGPTRAISIGGTGAGGTFQEILVDANGHVQVDVLSAPTTTVTGTVTADAGSGTFTVDNAGTFAVQVDGDALTSLQLIDDAVAAEGAALNKGVLIQGDDGTDRTNVLVDTDGHLQVDVLSGGGGGTQYTEDDAAAANPVGTMPVMVRDDTPGTLVSTDGDVVAQRATNYGAAFVQVLDSSGNFIDTFGGSGGTASTDDGAFTAGSGQGTPMMGFATSDAVDSGDVGVLAMDTARNLKVIAQANSGVDIGDVDVTSVTPGTAAGNLGKAEDAAHTTGDTGVMALAVRNDDLAALAGTDGDYAPLQVTENGALLMCMSANDDYKYADIDEATSGNNTLVAAVASRKIRVLSAFLVSAGTVTARFEDGASGTALTGQMNLVANSGFTLPYNPAGWFETGVNTLLNLELSAAVSVDGCLTYIEVP